MSRFELSSLGWKSFFQEQIASDELRKTVIARVSAHYGSRVLVLSSIGELSVPVQLAESAGDVAVGDWLVLDANDHRAVNRLERQSLLYRKASGEEVKPQVIAANIDTIFVVSSCNRDFNLSRIERYLALALQSGATPVIVLTKADLCESPEEFVHQAQELREEIAVQTLDARQPSQVSVLKEWCGIGETIALLGSSGVGKSTLANALGVGGLATGAIREYDDKGRHTTTSRSLHLLPSGGVLIDNPGVRELQLPACEDGIADLFEDVIALTHQCRFRNCSHSGDAGCAIEGAIEAGELSERRFNSFMKLQAEQEHNSRSLAERHERERKFGRMYKSVMAEKRRQRNR